MPLANLAIEQPEEALQAIMTGTMNVLQVARDIPTLKRFVYVSSSMVYGDFVRTPIREDDPKDPKEIYGSIKLSGELITRAFSRLFDIQFSIVRPSAVYGPTDNNRRVLGIFCENALSGKPLIVKGTQQALDFTFVTDIATGIALVTLHEKGAGKAFNVTRGRGRTILEAAEIVARLVPGTRIDVADVDGALPTRGTLDITAARELVGYEPKVDIEEGLGRYIDHLRAQCQAGLW
jgi:nucleoside-diphosphate-sugar epimerase